MKTGSKITLIVIMIVSVLFVPPNIAAFTCNTLEIKDIQCHIMGMSFFGIQFKTNVYEWFEWTNTYPCGGVLAHPDRGYNCMGIEDYWGLPPDFSSNAEREQYVPDKNIVSEWMSDEDYCQDWCDQEELYSLGCDQPILAHLTKYSNLLSKEFDGAYYVDFIGLPDGVSQKKFDWCVDLIYEKRILMESERLSQVLRLCENTNAQYLGALSFENSTHHIDSQTCKWKLVSGKIISGSYELENPLCMGGRGMIVDEDCERIGKYDPATGLPIVENKKQCDMLNGNWDEQQNICDSKYDRRIENED